MGVPTLHVLDKGTVDVVCAYLVSGVSVPDN